MAADDLTTPLGLAPRRKPYRRLSFGGIAVAALVIAAGAALVMVGWSDNSPTEAPQVAAKVDAPAAVHPSADATGSVPAHPPPVEAVPVTENGLTEVMPDGALQDVGGEVVIHDPSEPAPIRLASAPDAGLVEESRYGLLPRVGDDGTRPLDAYARPADIPAGMKRIAIVVGGIGLAREGTEAAIATLPGAVTLAFAPYGANLPQTLARARDSGHEVLLQVPLEPFDYPEDDPGPHTLTVGASPKENLDRLRWIMCRITTYVGVMNYMGGRFTGDAEALAPVVAEIGERGLLYFDDGTSSRSAAGTVAAGTTPYLRADVVLDSDDSPEAIDQRLEQLAAIARERGHAVGVATAFPTSIDRIAAFARAAADRGIVLVPVSALATSGRT